MSSTSNGSYNFSGSGLPMGNGTLVARSGNSLSRESTFVQNTMLRHREAVNNLTPHLSNPPSVSTLINHHFEATTFNDDGSSMGTSLNSSISTGKYRRSSYSPKNHIQANDFSIFKGPQTHIHGNKNVYDSKRLTWKPSTTQKKDERFQTTNELRNLEKTSKFLYNNQ